MSTFTNNYVINNGGGGGSTEFTLPTSQPTTPGIWNNNGVLTFFSGTDVGGNPINRILDTVEGQNTSVFGVPLGDI